MMFKTGKLAGRRGRIALVVAALAFAGLAAPASAQFSAGYKFLDAVKKKDGAAVEQALSGPGGTIVNTRDVTSGETALHLVTQRRDTTWMGYLLGHGANPNVRDVHGVTPLQVATNLGFTDGVVLLLQYKADPDQPNDTGETPLISAVHRKDITMLRALLGGGADPARADSSGRSARDYARLEGASDAMTEALSKQAHPRKAAQPVYGPSV